jgi:hypothetical protein
MADDNQTANLTDAFLRAIKAVTKYGHICDGIIEAVDETEYTADVKLDIDGSPIYYNVPLSVLIGSVGGFVPVPTIGSNCLLTFRDGNKGRPQLLFCDQIDKLLINCNIVQFNDGQLGGMVEVIKLVEKINNIENLLNGFIALYNTHVHEVTAVSSPTLPTTSVEGGSLTPTQRSDIENTKITQ